MAILRPEYPMASGVRSFEHFHPITDKQWQFDWRFTHDDVSFEGHFPHQPILPGVFLIEMAQRAAEFALRRTEQRNFFVNRIDRFRFMQSILPGDDCTLMLTWVPAEADATEMAIGAVFSKQGVRVAQGELRAVACVETAHAC